MTNPNPWSRSTPATWPLGPNQSTDNFSGLPAGQAKALGVINPATISQPFGDIMLPPWKIAFTSAPTVGTTLNRYLLFSEDNAIWTGGLSPTATADQSAALAAWLNYSTANTTANSLALIDTITTQSGVTLYYTPWVTIRGLIGNVPAYCAILVSNGTNVALAAYSSGNQSATYVTDSYVLVG